MKFDVVFPNNNEKQLMDMAKLLDFDLLYLAYETIFVLDKSISKYAEDIGLEIEILNLRSSKTFNKKKTNKIIIENEESNRQFFESRKVDFVFNLEHCGNREFIHHRNSGLNHVLCKLANERKITILTSLKTLLDLSKKDKSVIIGRIKQNISYCRKYKIYYQFISGAKTVYEMKSYHDLITLSNLF